MEAVLGAVPSLLAAAQDPLTPRTMLGAVGNDPTVCAETPEAIRRLYAECAGSHRGAAPGARRSASPTLPAEKPSRAALAAAGCRDVLFRIQLGEEPSDADLAYERSHCHVHE